MQSKHLPLRYKPVLKAGLVQPLLNKMSAAEKHELEELVRKTGSPQEEVLGLMLYNKDRLEYIDFVPVI